MIRVADSGSLGAQQGRDRGSPGQPPRPDGHEVRECSTPTAISVTVREGTAGAGTKPICRANASHSSPPSVMPSGMAGMSPTRTAEVDCQAAVACLAHARGSGGRHRDLMQARQSPGAAKAAPRIGLARRLWFFFVV